MLKRKIVFIILTMLMFQSVMISVAYSKDFTCSKSMALFIRRHTSPLASVRQYYYKIRYFWANFRTAKEIKQFDEGIYLVKKSEYERLILKEGGEIPNFPVKFEERIALIETLHRRASLLEEEFDLGRFIKYQNPKARRQLGKILGGQKDEMSSDHIERFLSKLYTLYYGDELAELSIRQRPSKNVEKFMARRFQEEITKEGLEKIYSRFGKLKKKTLWDKILAVHNSRVMQDISMISWNTMFINDGYLPLIFKKRKFFRPSKELTQLVISEGLDKAWPRIVKEYGIKANAEIYYGFFKKYYTPLATGLMIYFFYRDYKIKQEEDRKKAEAEAERRMNAFLEQKRRELQAIKERIEKSPRDEFIEGMIKKYKERYSKDPTPKEIQEFNDLADTLFAE